MKKRTLPLGAMQFALSLVWAGSASAEWGYVSGKLQFVSVQGNYCTTSSPYNMDCTASRFPASIATGNQPVRDSVVVLRDQTGDQIGEGATDRDGNFTIYWSRSGAPSSITVRWYLKHVENRFRVVNTSDALYYGDVTTITSPQLYTTDPIGTWTWAATEVNNHYDAAQRTWYEAFQYSNRLKNGFTNVRIRWGTSGGASADFGNMLIKMPTARHRRPQSVLSHEMGHLGMHIGNDYKSCQAWNYPTDCSGDPDSNCTGTWNHWTSEHYCSGFTEAFASFLGTVSYYWHWADGPTICESTAPCGSSAARQLESSTGTGCDADTRHAPIETLRYLWDVYDSINDAGYNDSVNYTYYTFVDSMAEFPAGTGNGDLDEPWNTNKTSIDDDEGRSSRDYRKYIGSGSSSTEPMYANNCSPGHD